MGLIFANFVCRSCFIHFIFVCFFYQILRASGYHSLHTALPLLHCKLWPYVVEIEPQFSFKWLLYWGQLALKEKFSVTAQIYWDLYQRAELFLPNINGPSIFKINAASLVISVSWVFASTSANNVELPAIKMLYRFNLIFWGGDAPKLKTNRLTSIEYTTYKNFLQFISI